MILEIIWGFILLIATIFGVKHMLSKNRKLKAKEVIPNSSIVVNLVRTEFTDDYQIGRIKEERRNRNGTTYISYYPIDNLEGDFAENKEPEIQELVIETDNIGRIKKGRREILLLLSRDPTDYPDEIRGTLIEDWANAQTQKSFLKKVFKSQIIAGDKAIEDLTNEFSRGHMTKNVIEKMKEENRIAREMRGKEEKEN